MRKQHGFTLVELMVVIAILGILAGIVGFAFNNWRSTTARNEVKNELQVAAGAVNHYQTFNNALPDDQTVFNTLSDQSNGAYSGGNAPNSAYQADPNITMTYKKRADGNSFCLIAGHKTLTSGASKEYWYFDSTSSAGPTKTSCS